MTLDDLAYNLLDTIEGGRGTNDEYYSLEQLKFQILYYRALYLRRDASHDSDVQHSEQELTLALDIVTSMEDRNSVIVSDYLSFLLKSTTQIPPTIALRNSYDLTYVGSPVYDAIPLARFYQVKHLVHERYTSCTARSFVRDRYLYIINDPGVRELEKASKGLSSDPTKVPMAEAVVRGIFVDPRDVSGFDESSSEFPISPDLIQRITEGLLNGEHKFMTVTPTVVDQNQVVDAKEG